MKFWITANGYKIYQIIDGESNSFCSNSFLVEYEGNFIMIDTGSKKKWNELQINLNRIGVNQDNLKALILTHAHFDHVENALKMKTNYGTKIIINKLESVFLENGKNSKTGVVNFIIRLFKYESIKPDILTEEIYELNELGFKNCWVIKTAGHTAGSGCILIDDEAVITGDTTVNFSDNTLPWYIARKADLLKSWKKIIDTGSWLYLPGHGNAVKREILIKNYKKIISE